MFHLLKQTWFPLARKIQTDRRLRNQLDDFDRDIIIGNTASGSQQNFVVNESTVDHEITVNNTGSIITTNEILVNLKTLERCLNEKIDRESGNIVETVEYRFQNKTLNAIDRIVTPRIELAVR